MKSPIERFFTFSEYTERYTLAELDFILKGAEKFQDDLLKADDTLISRANTFLAFNLSALVALVGLKLSQDYQSAMFNIALVYFTACAVYLAFALLKPRPSVVAGSDPSVIHVQGEVAFAEEREKFLKARDIWGISAVTQTQQLANKRNAEHFKRYQIAYFTGIAFFMLFGVIAQ